MATRVEIVDLDEARALGEVDDDPPPGDFNDAASLAIVSLAELCGIEDPGAAPVPHVLAQVRLRLKRAEILRTRNEEQRHLLDAVEAALDSDSIAGARELLRDRHLAKAIRRLAPTPDEGVRERVHGRLFGGIDR